MITRASDSGIRLSLVDHDVAVVCRLIETRQNSGFFKERKAQNVDPPAPEFSRAYFWYVLVGCLLTTQQRSTKGSPVNRFLDTEPFPLAIEACEEQPSLREFVQKTIKDFGAIWRGNIIASQAAENWKRLNAGCWQEAEEQFERLKGQRSRKPRKEDRAAEREAAHWADAKLAGIGPKQSRNLWQWLGLTRYEVPLDSRVTKWVNQNLSIKIADQDLNRIDRYESALDRIQAICDKAGILPCELDAAAFDYEDEGGGGPKSTTTLPGFINPHGQITIRNTGVPGTDKNQYIYQLACSICGQIYGANGSDIHERKCPVCQGGRKGLEV